MKTRQGFVSNSSSASYIVNMKMSYDDLINFYINETSISWRTTDILDEYKEHIDSLDTSINNAKSKSESSLFIHSIEWLEKERQKINGKYVRLKSILKNNKFYTTINTEDKRIIVTDYLEYHNISLTGDNLCSKIQGRVIMHNSFEDIPHYITALVTHFAFNNPEVMICEYKDNH